MSNKKVSFSDYFSKNTETLTFYCIIYGLFLSKCDYCVLVIPSCAISIVSIATSEDVALKSGAV